MPKITIQRAKNTSLSNKCQPYARSATEKNLRANASSIKPNTILIVFIQLPDLGACLSKEGNNANKVNGSANARAKPSIPKPGPAMFPLVLT